MKHTRWAILTVLLGFLITGLMIWSFGPKEPTYQGRSLSSWLDEWQESSNDRTNPAAFAIRAIGSNGLPILLERLTVRKRSPFERKFWSFAGKFLPDEFDPMNRAIPRAVTAAEAINFLGVEANSAFPTLTNLFSDRTQLITASIALAGMPQGVGVLLKARSDPDSDVREAAESALKEIDPQAANQRP